LQAGLQAIQAVHKAAKLQAGRGICGNEKAIFVNGCFWHGHTCKKAHLPAENLEFWRNKVEINKKRDLRNYVELEAKGWKYLVVWECELKKKDENLLIDRLKEFMAI
jgi:G:T-mismatch repair DNA endonuclease (very short patch repair protein)